ncbi:tonB-dependent siderophore receptor [Plautia stali symbiont]|nr:tonB-dependent siderophore receptor [Plautia stali symbiont]
MSCKEMCVRDAGLAPQRALRLSLLAVLVASGVAQAADTQNSEATLTVDASASAEAQQAQAAADYSVPVTRAGTKMALTARDIPQSVTIVSKQRM